MDTYVIKLCLLLVLLSRREPTAVLLCKVARLLWKVAGVYGALAAQGCAALGRPLLLAILQAAAMVSIR